MKCSPCLQARVLCVTSASLKRNRKRKRYAILQFFHSGPFASIWNDTALDCTYGLLTRPSFYENERHDQSQSQSSTTPPSIRDGNITELSNPTPQNVILPSSRTFGQASQGATLPSLPDASIMTEMRKVGWEQNQSTGVGKEPVIGHMGRLVTDDRQAAMFGGSTTGVHFISQTEQQLQMLQTHKDALPSSAYGLYLHSLWGSSQSVMPSPIVSDIIRQMPNETLDIVGSTIDHWTPLYPIVHKPSIEAAAERMIRAGQVGDDSDIIILHQVLVILALGTVGQPGGCTLPHHHFLCLSDRFYAISATLQDYIINQASLQSLQSLVLTQIYLQISNRYSRASHLSGVATRLAQTLGLHRHSLRFKFDPLETELRKRAWWCQYSLDAYVVIGHSTPKFQSSADKYQFWKCLPRYASPHPQPRCGY